MGRGLAGQEANGQAQAARVARAIAEGPEYQWRKAPNGWVVETPSGGTYLVTERGECSCMDYQKTCCGCEVRCKHAVALKFHLAAQQECPAPAPKPQPCRGMTDAEVERFDRLFA